MDKKTLEKERLKELKIAQDNYLACKESLGEEDSVTQFYKRRIQSLEKGLKNG